MALERDNRGRHRAVPSSRFGRLSGFGRLAGGVAGGMLAEGARRVASGEQVRMNDLVLTPGNIGRLTERLSHLRGAAMKMGQMLSMDAGDALRPELSEILAKLRDNADFMPPRQLDRVLAEEWGADWRKNFRRFEPRPIAAASIGQVHRALTRDGRTLAIKVQYPGVKQSIDSDVDNVATLLRITGLLPKELDIKPLLAAAKEQLHEEADYRREGRMMERYGELLAGHEAFVVPTLDEELTRDRILAMSYEEGRPVEQLGDQPQDVRDAVFAEVIELVARELFEWGLMQTDPNFANYRYRDADRKIVLLDFGATREVDAQVQQSYRNLLRAGLDRDHEGVQQAAIEAKFMSPAVVDKHGEAIDRMIDIILGEMAKDAPFDFGDRGFVPALRDEGIAIAQDKAIWHIPPAETLFVQRKVSGTALLGARIGAVVNIHAIVRDVLERTEP
ncbi:ABC1 kinase family protein [Alteriqipengyuania lutimaris]|uniref:AarF/ABC1/UbiB kinase family protein n=1 Tax=Alteriqipengyuania lutimaris TaxID=1538146 RepID=A0A395LQK0_9SPHN|nr:AarF/ABC1/UbiB kinase family protein [Alteriqipengyuania lutimaris]MBB3033092.1 putative unusual protein kinase regulating ubiquinone biosynthesis (AarF/ABC1/UbiB family) [Alteriqipengyuania lutimaris]RDS77844.1 AarF/ABC1/UbiB kinase family protein [Alteriqipengyuania lutimaris]